MAKALLLSVLVATLAIPIVASKDPDPRRGLRKTVRWHLAFVTIWVLACLFVYPRLL